MLEVREDGTRGGPVGQAGLDPGDRVAGGAEPEQVSHPVPGLDVEQPAGERSDLAGQARPGQDLLGDADTSREEGLRGAWVAVLEQPRPLQEELAFLRVEETEAIQVDLDVVRLDLREIRIHRQVQGEGRRNAVLDVNPEIPRERILEVRGHQVGTCLLGARDHIGLDLDVVAATDVLQPAQEAVPGNGRHGVERMPVLQADGRPEGAFVLPVDHPGEHQAEREIIPVGEAKLPERDGDLHGPSFLVYHRLGFEHRIPRESVYGDRLVLDGRIVLGPEGVHLEQVRVLPVEIGIETDIGMVVLVVAAAPLQVLRPDQVGFPIPESESEIQKIAVESDRYLRPLGRRLSVVRPALDELRNGLDALPGLVIQPAVDRGRLVHEDGRHLVSRRGRRGPASGRRA